MLRGFRWQVIALLVAAAVFIVSLIVRSGNQPAPAPATDTAQNTLSTLQPTAVATTITIVPLSPIAPSGGIVTFREALIGNVQRLNPLFANLNPVDQDLTSLIFEGLTRSDAYGQPQPALAKSWVTSSDGLEWVFTLRDDVLWQDGIRFSAADVIYTMSLLRSPDFPGSADLGAFWRTVETEQIGDNLVRFRLTQPLGSFLTQLEIGILPAHVLSGTPAARIAAHPFNLSPIGTGPYQLEALRTGTNGNIQTVDLRVAPVYRQRPEGKTGYALERLRFNLYPSFDEAIQALQRGTVDALATRNRNERPPLLNRGFNAETALEPTVGLLIFNWAKDSTKYFHEQRLRTALETGLNRDPIIERHLANVAARADSPLLPGSWAYSADLPWPTYDPDKARSLIAGTNLQVAGSTPTPTTTPSSILLSFHILVPNDPALVAVAQEIAAQWSQYNLEVTVDAVDLDTYHARLISHDFDTALVELSLGADPDVYAYWHQGQYPDGKNYGGADDRHISEDLERARSDASSTSGVNRAAYYQQFQRDFIERAIAIPLYYPLFTYALSPKVEGVQLGFIGAPQDRFRTVQQWTIKP